MPFTEAMPQKDDLAQEVPEGISGKSDPHEPCKKVAKIMMSQSLKDQLAYDRRMEKKRTRQYEAADRARRERGEKSQKEVMEKWPQLFQTSGSSF